MIRAVDRFQQRHRPLAFTVAVVKKFSDDRAGMLAAVIAYHGFLALFPALLLLVTVLGLLLRDDPSFQHRVLDSALRDFPIIGDQLRANIRALTGNGFALGVGAAGSIWGALGVTQAAQHAMAEVWNLPARDRPSFWSRLARGLAILALLGLAALGTTALAGLATLAGTGTAMRAVHVALLAGLNVALYWIAFRILTPGRSPWSRLLPGAVLGGAGWTVLQLAGTYLVDRQLREASAVYGFFAIVIGLLAWLHLGAQLLLYSAEVNVVVARRLWPRSIVQPPLTTSDRVVLRDLVAQEARVEGQRVAVTFDQASAPQPDADEVRAGSRRPARDPARDR
jgi:YihY family inner membrane protein